MVDTEQLYIEVVSCSQQMLNCAEQGRWDELAQLDLRLVPKMKKLFTELDNEQLHSLSGLLLEQNQQIQKLIKAEQKKILLAQSEEQHNINAVRSYLKSE